MDTVEEVIAVADELQRLATRLYGIDRALTGRPSERATHELARSIAYWTVALRRLSIAGPAAWRAIDSRFPPDPDDPVETDPNEPVDPLAQVASESDVISAYIAGDMALDNLAHAELVLRARLPDWVAGVDRVPSMWPLFMRAIDADTTDPMTSTLGTSISP